MRTPVVLYLLALLVRAVLVAAYPDPGYTDSFYYTNAARAIQAGQGLSVDFVWIFAELGGIIPADPALPVPAFGHWMPLASLVQVPFLAVFGAAAWASAVPFALIGSLTAPLTWAIARDAGARPTIAIAAGLLGALPALATVFMPQPDNFALFQPLVAAALWMTARGLRGFAGSFVLAGLLAGLATLSRTDGLLVFGVVVVAFAWDRWRVRGGASPRIGWETAVAAGVAFLVVMAPWWLRQLAVFGTLSPATASGKVTFIREIGEWDSIATPATLDYLLGMGAGPLLATRVGGLIAAIAIFTVLVAAIVLLPLMLIGASRRPRSVEFGPFFLYALLLFGFSTIVSAVHVPGGTFIHSAVALAPHAYILAVEGLAAAVAWLRRHGPEPDAERPLRLAAAAMVGLVAVFAFVGTSAVHGGWGSARDRLLSADRALDAAGAAATDRVMSIDAAATRYWTGHGGVVLVNDPIATIGQVAAAYDIRWLILERGAVAATTPILDGNRPAWVGPPILEQGDPVELAVYPVDPEAAR